MESVSQLQLEQLPRDDGAASSLLELPPRSREYKEMHAFHSDHSKLDYLSSSMSDGEMGDLSRCGLSIAAKHVLQQRCSLLL